MTIDNHKNMERDGYSYKHMPNYVVIEFDADNHELLLYTPLHQRFLLYAAPMLDPAVLGLSTYALILANLNFAVAARADMLAANHWQNGEWKQESLYCMLSICKFHPPKNPHRESVLSIMSTLQGIFKDAIRSYTQLGYAGVCKVHVNKGFQVFIELVEHDFNQPRSLK